MSLSDKKVMIVGDIHGSWGDLNALINKRKPEIMLACGDFGYWPLEREYAFERIKPHETKIYFCDGNHEHHDLLDQVKSEDYEIVNNVFYMKRGTIIDFKDFSSLGNVLFMGGADSIDKMYRVEHIDWFRQEVISNSDVMSIPENAQIDTVISHTCPLEFEMDGNPMWGGKSKDPSRNALSYILNTYKPRLWYFGHWHYNSHGKYKSKSEEWFCSWHALSYLPMKGSWEWY